MQNKAYSPLYRGTRHTKRSVPYVFKNRQPADYATFWRERLLVYLARVFPHRSQSPGVAWATCSLVLGGVVEVDLGTDSIQLLRISNYYSS
jgi:hypothetical protein